MLPNISLNPDAPSAALRAVLGAPVSLVRQAAKGRNVKIVAMAIGFIIGAIGIVGVGAPSVLLEFGRSLLTPTALYIIAVLRIGIGVVFVWVAPVSRMPKALRVLGILIIIAGVLTPFFGIERSRAVLHWWSSQGPLFMRLMASVAVAIGLFIVYVVTPRRTAA